MGPTNPRALVYSMNRKAQRTVSTDDSAEVFTEKPKISVLFSAYNEADCVDELARRLTSVFDQHDEYRFEVIAVENGSSDDTYEKLLSIQRRDPRFRILQLSRNFRMDGGLTAGLEYVDGDAVVLMAADLQDPPELISALLDQWELGYENVYGVVCARHGTPWLRRFNSAMFYRTIGALTGQLIPPNASDFRLLDRRAYEAVRSMHERNRFVRGLVAWVGFRSIGVNFERPERHAGESKARTTHVVALASKGVIAHSQVPLVMVLCVGITLAAIGALGAMASVVGLAATGQWAHYWGALALVVLLFGILCGSVGVVGLYVGQAYEEVKQRPNFVVRQVMDAHSHAQSEFIATNDSSRSAGVPARGASR